MPLNFDKLRDKHVLVIGGSSGIGLAVAAGALASGARVTISSSSPSKISAAVSALKSYCPTSHGSDPPNTVITGIPTDLSDPSTVEASLTSLFTTATAASGAINHVVYTAADALSLGPLSSLHPDLIHAASHMRMVVPLILAKVATRYLPPQRQSSLTITSGCVADKPDTPGWAAVVFLAGGLVSLTKALAVEMRPVRVNVVQCGYTDTPLWGWGEEDGDREKKKKREVVEGLEAKMLTGKFGEVEDVAEAYLWVLRDGNVTGAVAKTDGGVLLT